MEARLAAELPVGEDWWFEPKWDGFRCLALRDGGGVRLQAKSGKSLDRYFPEVTAALSALSTGQVAVDGELLGAGPAGFAALQMRLHPSETRIRRLANAAPAHLMLFDMLLAPDGADLRDQPFRIRRRALEAFVRTLPEPSVVRLTPGSGSRDQALAWLADPLIEGVVAKDLSDPYREGERAMIKVKRRRTADCVVGGFRYARDTGLVGSLLLGLYNAEGRLDHVGFTSGLAARDKPDLTRRLEALRGEGFTGKAPGGPSRWSTGRSAEWVPLRPDLVVEVSYDHVAGGRFRHGVGLVRFRPDKSPRQCGMEQIE